MIRRRFGLHTMRCPNCQRTLETVYEYENPEFVCESCNYFLPRGTD